MSELPKAYDPQDVEKHWYEAWLKHKCFSADEHSSKDAYSIVIPPPNVTGILHIGHVLNNSIQDILARRARQQGKEVLWLPGTDHAGIATQTKVEKKIREEENTTRRELGRDEFLKRVWDWKDEHGGIIIEQLKRLGCSCDWDRERFTMDEGYSEWVSKVFVDLFNDGLIYRGKRMVNWCPVSLTALSDEEVIAKPQNSKLFFMKYEFVDAPGEYLEISTTRPETLMGDIAVAVNPKDERFAKHVGRKVRRPFPEAEIPVIADDHVDIEFGTGALKITPAHDFNDYEMGKRHDLPMMNILDDNAAMNQNVPTAYQGMDRYACRKQVVADLDALGLLDKIDDHTLQLPIGDRSGVVVEPYLTDQWYVDAKTLAKPAIEAVENGDIEFVPKQYENIYFSWMRDIQDWCISRQLWWGHRIPAWYDEQGKVYVGRDEQEVRAKHNLGDTPLKQDNDVLDTWFSSALWTFSTLGWPEETEELKAFHPSSVLVTGFDIIFFWVARMIMMTLHFKREVPFKQVYVHGLVRDAEGQKMSKSKGNVLDPIDLIDGIELEELVSKRTSGMMQPKMAKKIEKSTRKQFPEGIEAYGTDALRFTYYSLASTGRDIKFDMGRIEGYRNFCNKIWNAARYVLMNTEEHDCGQDGSSDYELTLADRWIISRLQHTEQDITKNLDQYRFDLASQALYEFIWNEYCDWYLELSKPVLWDDNSSPALKKGTRRTLIQVLETTLRLLHPFMPFITEEIWQRVAPLAGQQGETIMLQAYPELNAELVDTKADADIEWVKGVIIGVRNIRGEMNISPAKSIPLLLKNGDSEDQRRLKENQQFLTTLAKLETITWLEAGSEAPMSATSLVGDMEMLVPMAGLIDTAAETARLTKEIEKLQKDLSRIDGKLNNPKFMDKAPEDVVKKEREKQAKQQQSLDKLALQLKQIQAM